MNSCAGQLASLYDPGELAAMLGSVGENVAVNRSVVFYAPECIHLGSNVRIDCFCVLSAGGLRTPGPHIVIGDHVHIAVYCSLLANSGAIHLEDFAGLAPRVTILTSTDDYSDGSMSNPTIPDLYRNVRRGDVVLKKHALVGSGAVLMPAVTLGTGAAVGALSFVNKSVPEFAVVGGNPIRLIGTRNRRILDLEREFLHEKQGRYQGLPQDHD